MKQEGAERESRTCTEQSEGHGRLKTHTHYGRNFAVEYTCFPNMVLTAMAPVPSTQLLVSPET